MNNYEYIIAGLPDLLPGQDGGTEEEGRRLVQDIRDLLSDKDKLLVDFLTSCLETENLNEEFYSKALEHSNRFIREYFDYDLKMRNLKVRYLNKALERPEAQDCIYLDNSETEGFEGEAEINAVLEGKDILQRERGLDELMWKKIEDITALDVFNVDVILGFIAKLMIVDRWVKLNPQTGHAMFVKLVDEVRATYDNKKSS